MSVLDSLTKATVAAKAVNAIIAAGAAVVGVFIGAYLFPKQAAERANAEIELYNLTPRFEVRYYGIFPNNLIYASLLDNKNEDSKHPLLSAKRITTKGKSNIPFQIYHSGDEVKSIIADFFPQLGSNLDREAGDNFGCEYTLLYIKYHGVYEIKNSIIISRFVSLENNNPDEFYFTLNLGSMAEEKIDNASISLGDMNPEDSFYLPIGLECGLNGSVFSYKNFIRPDSVQYFDPVLEIDSNYEIREILKDATIDNAGLHGRG